MAEIECACYLFAFLFTGYAIICADPQTRFPDEGEPDWEYEWALGSLYGMNLKPDFIDVAPMPESSNWIKALLEADAKNNAVMGALMGANLSTKEFSDGNGY
jgi:hypothetical protein